MKAAFYREAGPPSVLIYGDVPDPAPGPGEILIAVEAIAIEGGDVFSRRLAPPQSDRHVIGYQASGVVVALGEGAMRFRTGDRVATFAMLGSHAELRAVPEALAWIIPDAVPFDVGAAVPVTFGTADDALFDTGRLRPGETVLIQGGAGGVGIAAVQLARAAGATVIATSSSNASLARLGDYGMDHGINHRSEAVDARTRALTGGRGADLVIDMAGGAGFDALLRATARRGRIVTVGAASGDMVSVDLMTLVWLGVSVGGFMFGQEMATARARAIIDRHMAGVAAGALRMPIHRSFPLSEAAAAHREVETGHPFGRVIMHP